MKQKKVFLMSGPPASGKSSWIRSKLLPGSEWISRDKVRFAIVSEDEDYFAHEDEVFDTFIDYINRCLDDDVTDTIFIDATHLNEKSRHKTLSRVNKEKITQLNSVCFTTPLTECLVRNSWRVGREVVPDSVIRNMFNSYTIPTAKEGFDHIYTVDMNGKMKEVTV